MKTKKRKGNNHDTSAQAEDSVQLSLARLRYIT